MQQSPKVSKSQKQIFLFSILPKDEQKAFILGVENEDTSIPSYVFFEELRTRVKWGKLYNVS